MRRVRSGRAGGERGATSVFIAFLLVVLLGFAAIAVDVGLLYSERAQLQNGADASALAMAQECARNRYSDNCSATSPIATGLANQNASDNMSNVFSIQLEKDAQTVAVTTSAKEAGVKDNSVSLLLAGVLGFPTSEVKAKSSAEWGAPIAGPTLFPLAFSICQVQGYVDGPLQLLRSHSVDVSKGGNAKCKNTKNQEVPGGFGYLPTAEGTCGALVDVVAADGWVKSDPGVNEPVKCSNELNRWGAEISAGRKIVAYLPVFDEVKGEGNNAEFHLVSFAAFEVTGWKLSGSPDLPFSFRNRASADTGVTASTECLEGCRGVIGRFIRYASLAEGFKLGTVSDPNGAYIVRLTL